MEDFVSFEIAKKLKEKGFREECFGYYGYCEDVFYYNVIQNPIPSRQLTFKDFKDCQNVYPENNRYDAPTISQVLKWLRKENHIHINTSVYKDESEDADGRVIEEWCFWNWDIQNCNSGDVLQDGDDIEYESYEQAALASIEYILDNLI